MTDPLVAVICGSNSDAAIAGKACEVLDQFEIPYDYQVISAHRAAGKLGSYLGRSKANIFIAIAGLAAHLPGVIASKTTRPVIGVPVKSEDSPGGLDALLSIIQMPSGVPVASVGLNNGRNAALLALRMLSVYDEGIEKALEKYTKQMEEKYVVTS